MSTTHLVTHSLVSVSRHRLRSAFIMLASFVGVAALTFVLAVGQGARRKVLATVQQIFGESSLVVVAGGNQLLSGPRPGAARLTVDDIDAVAKALPAIEIWDPQQTLMASVRCGHSAGTVRVLGQSERAERVWGRGASRGSFFDATAVKRLDRVALVGETVGRDLLGGRDPIGAEILIESVPFTVVGVLERFGTDIHGMDRDNEIVVPISTLMRRVQNVDTIVLAKLRVAGGREPQRAAAELRRLLRLRHGLAAAQPDDFVLLTPDEVQRMVGNIKRVLELYLPLAAIVVLLVGGMVAATLMIGAVNARVAEIGLRRAVGAEPRDIAAQFLVETLVTVFGGGVVGVGVGLAIGAVLARRLQLDVSGWWIAVAAGLAMSLLTGFLAGVVPARRAARLAPADALR